MPERDHREDGLASYAIRSASSRGRAHEETFRDDRLAFERDRDRIIHCAAFRRLEYKTQVFINHEGDYYRTRLTHSLEVAQIARSISRSLGLNEDLAEAISLGHDLGHTPFGHAGEEAMDEVLQPYGGFEHNINSLRIVEELEERYPEFKGLNLTYEVREGMVKKGGGYHGRHRDRVVDFEPEKSAGLEAQLIDLADEIAYNNHDVDDGLKSGLLSLDQMDEVEMWRECRDTLVARHGKMDDKTLILRTVSAMISVLIADLTASTRENIKRRGIRSVEDVRDCKETVVDFSEEAGQRHRQLKVFLMRNLYRHHKVERMRFKAGLVVRKLFEAYTGTPSLLTPSFRRRLEAGETVWRVVSDYIAMMTDRYAMDEYRRLFEPYDRLVSDPYEK